MARSRIEALVTISRLADRRLETDASALTSLRGQIASLQAAKAELRYKAAHEGCIQSVEAAPYVSRFLRSLRREEARIDAELTRLDRAAVAQEAIVRASFVNAKAMSGALESRKAAQLAEAARQERNVLDEFGTMHRGITSP